MLQADWGGKLGAKRAHVDLGQCKRVFRAEICILQSKTHKYNHSLRHSTALFEDHSRKEQQSYILFF
jgi:hypothetical protein